MTRHCSACGAALTEPLPTTCDVCGAEQWDNAKPAAAALVLERGSVLLTRRAHAPWRGLWCAPSGFCDGVEHPITAAERETREETGLAIRVVGYLGTWVDAYADPGEHADAHVSVAYYAARALGSLEPEPDPVEVSEARWWRLDALPDGLAPPGTLEQVLGALRAALAGPGIETLLPDRPSPR